MSSHLQPVVGVFVGVFVLFTAATASATCVASGVPSAAHSEVQYFNDASAAVSLFVAPDGTGAPFHNAHQAGGAIVDATITLILRDEFGSEIADFPREAMWLEAVHGELAACDDGTTPDDCTDSDGIARWHASSPRAGGYTPGPLKVMIQVGDDAVRVGGDIHIGLVSPDINGDLVVDLCDLGLLATDFVAGEYNQRSDFDNDGIVNFSDLSRVFSYLQHCTHCLDADHGGPPESLSGRIGIYFDTVGHENTLFVDPFLPFTFHILALDVPASLRGWALALAPDPLVAITGLSAASSDIFLVDHQGAVAVEGFCLPEADVVVLATGTGLLLGSGENIPIDLIPADWCLSPTEEVSVLICEGTCTWRAISPEYVSGAILNPLPVATMTKQLSEIKALFR